MPAESKKQQRFFGMVHAVQKGELSPGEVGPAVRKAAKNTDYSDAKDIASTKHKNLPEKIGSLKEEIIGELIGAGIMVGAGAGTLMYVKNKKKKLKQLKKQGWLQMKYFEKIAISKEEKEIYKQSPYRLIPYAGPYFGTPEKLKKEHPVVSAFWGTPGALGARSKDTGKPALETAVKTEAMIGTGLGTLVGTAGGLIVGAKGKNLAKIIAAAAGGGMVGGVATGAVAYGGGRVFGKKKFEKIAISKEEKEIYKQSPYRLIPYAGPYFGTPEKLKKEHPVVSAFWGTPGALGARSKDTGKPALETAVKTEAMISTGLGALAGTAGGLIAGHKGKNLAKIIAAATGGGMAGGAALGAVAYGGGHVFGKKKQEK